MRQNRKGEERPFGGCNLLFFVDWWQLPPVKCTDLKSTPYPDKAASPMVQKSMSMFWSRGVDSLTGMTELTHSYRQGLDPWFAEFLRQCRHGKLSWAMYCFFHGLPTLVPGSWMPHGEGSGRLLQGWLHTRFPDEVRYLNDSKTLSNTNQTVCCARRHVFVADAVLLLEALL